MSSPSLLTLLKDKLLEAIRSVNPPSRWKVLVIDQHSKKILESVLTNNDILDEKVSVIEDIVTNREPDPNQEAIYLLMPTTRNFERLIQEYSNGRQQYKVAHVFFIDGASDELIERIQASPVAPHLGHLQDLYVNFSPIESQAFSIRDPSLFFSIYSPPKNPQLLKSCKARLMEDLVYCSKVITNLCISLGEFPYVRYYMPTHHVPLGPLAPNQAAAPPPQPEAASRWRTNLARGGQARDYEASEKEFVTKVLAWMVQDTLEEFKKQNPDFPPPSTPPRPRGVLLITDRAMDLIAPLIHEFTYQAMANDLLRIVDGSRYMYKFRNAVGTNEDKTAVLSDTDPVWTETRHMHMKDAIEKLMGDFNKFMQEHGVFKGDGAVTLSDMKDMLASLPQFQEQREKFSLHLNMAQECMSIFESQKLTPLANVEQDCATGLTADGKVPKQLVSDMVPLLDSREVSNRDKVRIIALYIQFRDGVPDEDRRRLYEHARLTLSDQEAVTALSKLGLRISRTPTDKDIKKALKAKPSAEEEYDLSRFKPLLKTVIEDHVGNKLDPAVFPYVKDSPTNLAASNSLRSTPTTPNQPTSLRSARPGWLNAPAVKKPVENRQRILIFQLGGVTYSEMRTAYQLTQSLNKDIYIGSTHTITPEQFVDDLKVLDVSGVGSRAIPNGIRDKAHPSYQAFYDEKFFTQDLPPPASKSPMPPHAGGRKAAPPLLKTNSDQSTTSREAEKKKKGRFFSFK